MNVDKNQSASYTDEHGNQVTDYLMTYSEEERQANEINAANAKLVFQPSFYLVLDSDIDLNKYEMLIMAHIRSFAKKGGRYYFTNEQLAEMLMTSQRTITQSVKNLRDKKLIDLSYKRKGNGGQIRFIKLINRVEETSTIQQEETSISNKKKLLGISNKIISNKNTPTPKTKNTASQSKSSSPSTSTLNGSPKGGARTSKQGRFALSAVWDHYIKTTGSREQLKSGTTREAKIKARLKEFSQEDLIQAIDNCFSDPFNMGENDRNWKANADYLFRNYETTEKFVLKQASSKKGRYVNL